MVEAVRENSVADSDTSQYFFSSAGSLVGCSPLRECFFNLMQVGWRITDPYGIPVSWILEVESVWFRCT